MAWIFCRKGAYSIVRKGGPGKWSVRSRVRNDLVNLCLDINLPESRILTGDGTDYAFRLVINTTELSRVFAAIEESIDYSNFKSMVALQPDQVHKLHAYHEIWSICEKWQPTRAYADHRRVSRNVSSALNDVDAPFKDDDIRDDDFAAIPNGVRVYLSDVCGVDWKSITRNARLSEDLGLDSLDAVEALIELEKEIGCVLTEEEVATIKTVGDVLDLMERHAPNVTSDVTFTPAPALRKIVAKRKT